MMALFLLGHYSLIKLQHRKPVQNSATQPEHIESHDNEQGSDEEREADAVEDEETIMSLSRKREKRKTLQIEKKGGKKKKTRIIMKKTTSYP